MLGDRPEQVVYTLAEQSRQKHGTYVLITLLVLAVISLLALLAALVMQVLNPEAAANRTPAPIVQPPAGHSTLRPELFHAQGQQDIFDPIAGTRPQRGTAHRRADLRPSPGAVAQRDGTHPARIRGDRHVYRGGVG